MVRTQSSSGFSRRARQGRACSQLSGGMGLLVRSEPTGAIGSGTPGEPAKQGRLSLARYASLRRAAPGGSEEHTSELQSLMRTSYAVFCLKQNNNTQQHTTTHR